MERDADGQKCHCSVKYSVTTLHRKLKTLVLRSWCHKHIKKTENL